MRNLLYQTAALIIFTLGTWTWASPTPNIQNADIRHMDRVIDLDDAIANIASKSEEPTWISYSVPLQNQVFMGCTTHMGDCLCQLEGDNSLTIHGDTTGIHDPTAHANLFIRVHQGDVSRLRMISSHCAVDAGGRPCVLLSSVSQEQSIGFLDRLIRETGNSDLMDEAMCVLAMHRSEAAGDALSTFAITQSSDPELREKAIFWLGNSRGAQGYAVLEDLAVTEPLAELREKVAFGLYLSDEPQAEAVLADMVRNDSSEGVRGQAIFWLGQKDSSRALSMIQELIWDLTGDALNQGLLALSEMHDEESVSTLIDVARRHSSHDGREQAVFWLGQKAGDRAVEALQDFVDHDPDLEIKKKAVFALSQLESDEGLPALIRIARSHDQPEIRKQAFFWLGQTGSDEALEVFEDVLLGD